MPDNVTLDPGAGGATVRTLEDAGGVHWPAGVVAYATAVGTPDVPQVVTPAAGLPVQPQAGAAFPVTDNGGSLTVDGTVAVSGTVTVTATDLPTDLVRYGGAAVGAGNALHVQPGTGAVFQVGDGGSTLSIDDGGSTLSIDDGGGSITVDGTVAVSGGTVAVSGEVDVLPAAPVAGEYLPVRLTDGSAFLAAVPVTDNNGSLTVDDGGGSLTVDGSVSVTGSLPARSRTADSIAAALQTDALMAGLTALTPKFAKIDAALSGDNTVVAAVASKKIRVLNYTLVADGAVAAKFTDGAGGADLSGAMNLPANGGASPAFSPLGHLETGAGNALVLNLSAAVGVRGHLTYVEV